MYVFLGLLVLVLLLMIGIPIFERFFPGELSYIRLASDSTLALSKRP